MRAKKRIVRKKKNLRKVICSPQMAGSRSALGRKWEKRMRNSFIKRKTLALEGKTGPEEKGGWLERHPRLSQRKTAIPLGRVDQRMLEQMGTHRSLLEPAEKKDYRWRGASDSCV